MQWNLDRNFKYVFGYIFVISIFWSFVIGFTISGNLSSAFLYIFLGGITAYFIFLELIKIDLYVSLGEIISVLLASLIFYFLLPSSSESLNTDQWYHFFSAYAPLELTLEKLPINSFIHNLSINLIFYLYSLFSLLLLFCLYLLYRKHKSVFFFLLAFASIVLIFSKFFLGILDTASPHPELRTLPLLLLGVFGISDASFKFINLLPLMVLVLYIYKVHFVNRLLFLMLICFIFSFPLIFFNIAIIEFSIWLFSFNTIMLLEFSRYPEHGVQSKNIKILLASLVLICLIRQPAIFSFAPILVYIFLYKRFSELKFFMLCMVIPVIQLSQNLLIGNPALSQDASYYNLLYSSFSLDTLVPIFVNIGPLLFLVIVSFFFSNTKNNLVLIIFLQSYWLAFHLIDPILWGMPRYLTEYIAPVVVIGVFLVMHKSFLLFCTILLSALVLSSLEIKNNIDEINAKNTQEWFLKDSKNGIRKYHSQIGSPWQEAVSNIPDELLSRAIFEGFIFKTSALLMSPRVSVSDYLSSKSLTEQFFSKSINSNNSCKEILYNMYQASPLRIISHNELNNAEVYLDKRWGTKLWIKDC